jgi:Flp pilus assembly pilin Flp
MAERNVFIQRTERVAEFHPFTCKRSYPFMLKTIVWTRELAWRLAHDRKGVTAMEYGIIASTTVVVVGGVVAGLGTPLNTIWNAISTALTTAANAIPA